MSNGLKDGKTEDVRRPVKRLLNPFEGGMILA